MPELPEVETVKNGLAPVLEGATIIRVKLNRPDLRFAFPDNFPQRLEGRRILRLERRAKYILTHLDNDDIWMSHLGMTGRFTIFRPGKEQQNLAEFYFQDGAAGEGAGKHDHFIMQLDNDAMVVYTDPRRFGFMDLFAASDAPDNRFLRNIGVEPLGNELHGQYLSQKLKTRKSPLKSALLDQKIIAGLGNIYVCEALFRARLSPLRLSSTLYGGKKAAERCETLIRKIRDCLNEAILAGGSTLRDYANADGGEGSFQQSFDVYDREGEACRREGCDGTIKRITQSGRSTFYCPKCQK